MTLASRPGSRAYLIAEQFRAPENPPTKFGSTTAGISPADAALPLKMLTVQRVVALRDRSESTVHRLRRAKKLRGKRMSVRGTMAYADCVTAFINSCPDRYPR